MNELVAAAIRDKGVITVLRTMDAIDSWSTRTTVLCPSLDVFLRGRNDALTDIDILAIYDGKFVIGEVKSSANSFKEKDFADLLRVAEIVNPNEVLLAAPSDPSGGWPALIEAGRSLATSLAPKRIGVLKLELNWDGTGSPKRIEPTQ